MLFGLLILEEHISLNFRNVDLFEILNSDREGRSEHHEENKYGDTIPEFEGEGEGDYLSHKSRPKLEKLDMDYEEELESSEEFSSNNDTSYYNNIRERIKKYVFAVQISFRARYKDDLSSKSAKRNKKRTKIIYYKSRLRKLEKEMDEFYRRNKKVNYALCSKIENEVVLIWFE